MNIPAISKIDDSNLVEFCQFLHLHLNSRRSVEEWLASFRPPWGNPRPNYGFLIKDEANRVVGGIGAIYSNPIINGCEEKFCNITSWCVLDEYRTQSMRLALTLTSQPGGYTFTDFSPTQVVCDVLKFFKFKTIEENITLYPNIPKLTGFSRTTEILFRDSEIQRTLSSYDLHVYQDHVHFPWLNHVVLVDGTQHCHIIYKIKRLKKLPAAKIVYVGNYNLFAKGYNNFSRHLLFKKLVPITMIPSRFLYTLPLFSKEITGYIPKNYYSENLELKDINYLYSETMCMNL